MSSKKVQFDVTPRKKYVEPVYKHKDATIPNPPTMAALHRFSIQKAKNDNMVNNWLAFLEAYASFLGVSEYMLPEDKESITITTVSQQVEKIQQLHYKKFVIQKQRQFYKANKDDEGYKRIFDGLFWTTKYDKMRKSPTAQVVTAPPQPPRTPRKAPLRPRTTDSSSRSSSK